MKVKKRTSKATFFTTIFGKYDREYALFRMPPIETLSTVYREDVSLPDLVSKPCIREKMFPHLPLLKHRLLFRRENASLSTNIETLTTVKQRRIFFTFPYWNINDCITEKMFFTYHFWNTDDYITEKIPSYLSLLKHKWLSHREEVSLPTIFETKRTVSTRINFLTYPYWNINDYITDKMFRYLPLLILQRLCHR